jgi:hypothetical protein
MTNPKRERSTIEAGPEGLIVPGGSRIGADRNTGEGTTPTANAPPGRLRQTA